MLPQNTCFLYGEVLFPPNVYYSVSATTIRIEGITNTSELYFGEFVLGQNEFTILSNNSNGGLTTSIPVNIVDTSGNIIDTISTTLTLSSGNLNKCYSSTGNINYNGQIFGSSNFFGNISSPCKVKYPNFNGLSKPINLTSNGVQFSNGNQYSVTITGFNIQL